jgi:LmbE family N-acetylglucosaminyl deacetylase
VSEAVDILVVTAHPDDAEFGVAGTVARWTQEGKQVVYVVCTNG